MLELSTEFRHVVTTSLLLRYTCHVP